MLIKNVHLQRGTYVYIADFFVKTMSVAAVIKILSVLGSQNTPLVMIHSKEISRKNSQKRKKIVVFIGTNCSLYYYGHGAAFQNAFCQRFSAQLNSVILRNPYGPYLTGHIEYNISILHNYQVNIF